MHSSLCLCPRPGYRGVGVPFATNELTGASVPNNREFSGTLHLNILDSSELYSNLLQNTDRVLSDIKRKTKATPLKD